MEKNLKEKIIDALRETIQEVAQPAWEATKEVIRIVLSGVFGFLINSLVILVSEKAGYQIPQETQFQMMTYGVALVGGIIRFLDKFVHKLGKKAGNEFLIKGIVRF